MDLNELAVDYYHRSLALAQKTLLGGLTVASVAYLVVMKGESKASYVIPIVEVEVSSLNYFTTSLLILFIACGVICCYGISSALDNWKLISNKDLSARLLNLPSVFLMGVLVDALLHGFLIIAGGGISEVVFGVKGWEPFVLGFIVTLPYLFAFRLSSDLRHFRKQSAQP